jgi:hypothetical protein
MLPIKLFQLAVLDESTEDDRPCPARMGIEAGSLFIPVARDKIAPAGRTELGVDLFAGGRPETVASYDKVEWH